jgi:hypothetical protein
MMAVAASNPSATPTPRKQAFRLAWHVQYAKPPICKVANMQAANMQAARQLFET